jgi:hypothetical protein
MKKLFAIAAASLGVAVLASDASASGCASPYCAGVGSGWTPGGLFMKRPLPAFQAAPWYLYWPYNAHFQTPAPLTGPYYAPPYSGGALVNPYFPAQPVAPVVPPGAIPPAGTLPPAGSLPPNGLPIPPNGNGARR